MGNSTIDLKIEALYDIISEYSTSSGVPIKYVGGAAFYDDPALTDTYKQAGALVVDNSYYLRDKFKRIFQSIHNDLMFTNLWNLYEPILTRVSEDFTDVQRSDFSFIQNEVNEVSNQIHDLETSIKNDVEQETDSTLDLVIQAGNELINYTDSQIDTVNNIVSDGLQTAIDYTDNLISNVYDKIGEVSNNIINALDSEIDNISNKVDNSINYLTNFVGSQVDNITELVNESVQKATDFYTEGVQAVEETIDTLKDKVEELAKPLFSSGSKLIDYFLGIIARCLEKLTEDLPDVSIIGE